MPLLNRLAQLWKDQHVKSSSEKAAQFCAALGQLGCFIFASPTSRDAIKHQHEISEDESTFLSEIASCPEALLRIPPPSTPSASNSSVLLLPPFTTVIFQSSLLKIFASTSHQNAIKNVFSLLKMTPYYFLDSSPENILELLVYLLAVVNHKSSSSHLLTLDILLAAICTFFSPSSSSSSFPSAASASTSTTTPVVFPTPMIIALIRTASNFDQSQQNPVLNSSAETLEDVLPSVIKLFVQILSWSPPSSQSQPSERKSITHQQNTHSMLTMKNDFLREICAPILSQFGFEFLWKHFDQKNNHNSNRAETAATSSVLTSNAVIDLIHYCQSVSYAERLQLVLPKSLSLQLLPEISNYDSFFGGFGSFSNNNNNTNDADHDGEGTGSDTSSSNTLVPSFWMNAFRTLQFKCFYPPPLSSSRQKQVHNNFQQRGSNNNNNGTAGGNANDDDLMLLSATDENRIVALSVLRRNRFAAKVEASSSFTHQQKQQQQQQQQQANRFWIELYKSFLANNTKNSSFSSSSLTQVPSDVLSQMQKVLAVSSNVAASSSASSSSSYDPIMLATFFFTSSASVTESGRLWVLEKMFSPIHEILVSPLSSGGNNNNNINSQQHYQQLHSTSFSWLLAALVLINIAVSTFNEEDNPTKQKLFEASFVRVMLQKIQTLMNVSTKPVVELRKGRRELLPLISVMKLDLLICGFASSSSSADVEDDFIINRAAASFRNSFCRYGVVQNEFRKILRSSWEPTFEEEMKMTNLSNGENSSSPNENETSSMVNKKLQRIHFTLSEIFSLLTLVLSRVHQTLVSTNFVESGEENDKKDDDDDADDDGANGNNNSLVDLEYNTKHQFIFTTFELSRFIATEWRFAVDSFAESSSSSGLEDVAVVRSKIAGNTSSVIELCDSCLTKLGGVQGADEDVNLKNLVECVSAIRDQVVL